MGLLWMKVFHLLFVISWMAGIFYLPRLFVHHTLVNDPATHQRLCIMEKKLYGFTTIIASFALFTGFWLSYWQWAYLKTQGWFHAKLTCIVVLVGYHLYCWHCCKRFTAHQNTRSTLFYRIMNELPVFLLFGILALVVIRPF